MSSETPEELEALGLSGFHAPAAKIYRLAEIGGFTHYVPLAKYNETSGVLKSFEWKGATIGWEKPEISALVKLTRIGLTLTHEDGRYFFRVECTVNNPGANCQKVQGSEIQDIIFSVKDADNGGGNELVTFFLRLNFVYRETYDCVAPVRAMNWNTPPDPTTVFQSAKSATALPIRAKTLSVHLKR